MYFTYEISRPKLDRRTAKWALRLKSVFDDGSPETIDQLYIWATVYARRERASEMLDEPFPFTSDIDARMVFRVWEEPDGSELPKNLALYQKAVEEGEYPGERHPFDDLKII